MSEYIGDDLSSQKSIEVRARAISAQSYYFLWDEYDLHKGSTTHKIELEMEYADTLGASMSWTRLDHHYTEVLMQVEDYVEKLDDEVKSRFIVAYFSHYKNDLNAFIEKFHLHLLNNLSWTKDDEGKTNTWDGPVQVACAFKFDAFAMKFKFFNDLKTKVYSLKIFIIN